MSISATRLSDSPIIQAHMDGRMGSNINGPSLIQCPDWVANPLGVYYLYFSDHRGRYLRMAYADDLRGPWRMYEPGVLDLKQSGFPTETSLEGEFFYAHLASPDVHVLESAHEIRLYYHGLCVDGEQMTVVAMSSDGVNFTTKPGFLAPAYLKAFSYGDAWYGMTMPGTLVRSPDGLQPFEPVAEILPQVARHCAVLVDGEILQVVWSQVGDAPERLYYGRVDVLTWTISGVTEILRPEHPWEGAEQSLVPSTYGAADALVNELRDPCLYAEKGQIYLLYCGGGEAGIGLARLDV
jgi:hypothetical protein